MRVIPGRGWRGGKPPSTPIREAGKGASWARAGKSGRRSELERERTRELARIGSNLNQIARWANTHKENAEAVEVIAHLVS